MAGRLENKVALVTGGWNGIGKAICKRFAEEGAAVAVTDIDFGSARRVAEEITAAGGAAVAREQDVTDAGLWETLLPELAAELGGLNILVNNAGIGIPATVEVETLDGWRRTQSVNLESVFLGTQAAIRQMKEQGGSIINVSSIEGIIGEPLMAAYNASKAGVRLFTKSVALHCAAENYQIRINSIHPGFVETALVANAVAQLGEKRGQEKVERVLSEIPMQRFGTPLEIANGCLFLASDESAYMTGSELVMDGGYTAR